MSNCAIINEAIFVGLKKALEGGKLKMMHLVNVNSSHIAWQSLASGMAKSQSLQRITFNLMNISPEFVAFISPGLSGCPTLQRIDFSYNSMGDVAGSMFGKMLKAQADMREQHKWMASLRGTKKETRAIGLLEFHLKYNKLGE
jgi:Ran GTPase-activating protein (RanGAP) involved in mRNA processing and transport